MSLMFNGFFVAVGFRVVIHDLRLYVWADLLLNQPIINEETA